MPFLQTVLFAAVPLLAIVNPVTRVALFLDIRRNRSQPGRHAAALEIALGVWLVLTVSAVAGLLILDFLHCRRVLRGGNLTPLAQAVRRMDVGSRRSRSRRSAR